MELCRIVWTDEDIKEAFKKEKKRNPTNEEIEEIISILDIKRLEEVAIEAGWDIIENAVNEMD